MQLVLLLRNRKVLCPKDFPVSEKVKVQLNFCLIQNVDTEDSKNVNKCLITESNVNPLYQPILILNQLMWTVHYTSPCVNRNYRNDNVFEHK